MVEVTTSITNIWDGLLISIIKVFQNMQLNANHNHVQVQDTPADIKTTQYQVDL